MKKLIALALVGLFVFSGCTTGNKPSKTSTGVEYDTKNTVVKHIHAGEYENLDYLAASDELHIEYAGNVCDGLIEYDNYGVVKPGLATDWKVSEDGKVYTFNLREGVKWCKYDGSVYGEVKAQDFVDAAKRILDPAMAIDNADFLMSVIAGASEYYDGTADFDSVGIKATGDYTVEYTLISPTPYFISMLVYPAFFPVNGEWVASQGESYGIDNQSVLYCGAYLFSTYEPQYLHEYTKNENYWDKDHVYITKYESKYNKEGATLAPELFLRGEVTYSSIPNSIIQSWMDDPEKKDMVRPGSPSYYSYFYCLNFNQQFPEDRKAEGENWNIAVNNENFRKSIFHGLDRKALAVTEDPYDPEGHLLNTITPKAFAEVNGVDYTQIGELKTISETDSFNKELALQYKEKAVTELTAAGAKFPITIQAYYNPTMSDWADRSVILKQTLENLLGNDYINVVYTPGPETSFLKLTRRAGIYAIQECNWGPDYADPETYSDPFAPEGTYNFPEFIIGDTDTNGEKIYTNLLNAAKAERVDIAKRYELFAKAEAFLINKAYVIPYEQSNQGYVASYFYPFDVQYSPFGCSYLRWKGRQLLKTPMNSAEYYEERTKWLEEKAKASK